MTQGQSILVIDDDVDMGEFIVEVATSLGMKCIATTDPSKFLEGLAMQPDLILLDLLMPRIDGIELLRILGQQQCKAGIVLMSGIEKRIMELAEKLAAQQELSISGRLRKPFGIKELEALLRDCKIPAKAAASQSESVEIEDDEIRKAIKDETFVLHFQPQIEIRSGKVVGLEALVRWLHPKYGLVYPDRFIHRAEKLAVLEDLTWIVLRKGVECWHQFIDIDGHLPHLSINISTSSLRDLRFPDKLEDLLMRFRMPPEQLVLEITESSVLDNLSGPLDVLTRLRLKGFQLSVDDFGTGYSMLQQLRRIPATELKIDKSFVQLLFETPSDCVVVQKTIEIGHDLGMRMVAEGVETEEQLDFLRKHSCDIAQGYLVYKPHPLALVVSWLREYRCSPATSLLDA